jgi:hypothetical protein
MTTSFDSGPNDPDQPEPSNLRMLRRLVTTLMVVMIGGFLVIVAVFVIRLSDSAPTLPDQITLPVGTTAEAVTIGRDWIAIISTDQRILIYDKVTGKLRKSFEILRE